MFELYPLPYLHWVVQDTLDIAAGFGLADVQALRVFLRLRFDVAPGFYRECAIAEMPGRRDLAPMSRELLRYILGGDRPSQTVVDARGVHFVSACQRGESSGLLGGAMARMRILAAQAAELLPPTAHIVEFACLPDGDIRLIEINPALELPELRLLSAA